MVTTTTDNPTMGPIQTRYHISTGKGTKMFTLWVTRWREGSKTQYGFYYERYLRNLSMDLDEAIAKAVEITGIDADNIDIEQDSVQKMEYGEDVLRFGRYDNQHVLELTDIKYLNWLAKGGNVQKEWRGEKFWEQILTGDKEKFKYFAQDRLIELGEWVNHNGRNISKEKLAKTLEVEAFKLTLKFGYHFTDGEKVKGSDLIVIDSTSYDNAYGTTFIVTLMDAENRVFTYKGGTLWWETQTKMIGCSFTVKHGEYNGVAQTQIQRVKVGTFANFEDTTQQFVKMHEESEQFADYIEGKWGKNPYFRLHKNKI